MKVAAYVTGAYAGLVLLSWAYLLLDPWVLTNINPATWCKDTCDAVTFFAKTAHLILVYPGLILVSQFVEFSYPSNKPAAFLVALITSALVFVAALTIKKVAVHARSWFRA